MDTFHKYLEEDADEFNNPEDFRLPPRRAVHPSDKEKMIRIFYRTLLFLFISLTVGLLIWGLQTNGHFV